MRRSHLTTALALFISAASAFACSAEGNDDELDADEGQVEASESSAAVVLEQGWTAAERLAWETTSDGSGIMPRSWLLALELPDRPVRMLSEEVLRQYGFIPSPKSDKNPDGLPIGMVKQANGDMIGQTCSGCHEAEVRHQGTTLRVQGGQGNSNSARYFTDAFRALAVTLATPAKFESFARQVLGASFSSETMSQLAARMTGVVERVKREGEYSKAHGISFDSHGPYRSDAFGHGLNSIAKGITLENMVKLDAPVNVPHLWGTHDFEWVQYNGSARQPMARNIISILARGAGTVTLSTQPGDPQHFRSVADLRNAYALEKLVAKLKAPKWPEKFLGAIDRSKAAAGQKLFAQSCASCHEPQRTGAFIDLKMIPLEQIGTDPNQATNFFNRKVDATGVMDLTGTRPLGVVSAAEFTAFATQGVMDRAYRELGVSSEERFEMDGRRPNEWRAVLAYRARPLDGIWATGPYLHNGSVPNLYEMLLPEEKRSTRFFTGSNELDVKKVGLVSSQGTFEFDTSLSGNSNRGHNYGATLTEAQRWELVEYLKTL